MEMGIIAMNWSWVYLNLRGRLSPKRFKSATSMLFPVTYIPTMFSYLGYLGRPDSIPTGYWLIIRTALLVCCLAAIWPWLAVTIKRLHDSERSTLLAIPALALPLAMVLVLTYDDLGGIARPIPYPVVGTVLLLLGCQIVLQAIIGKFRSIPGPNCFGPEPID
jgi:uncharacterized membrane protein YhaH (DUF805 family)